MSAVFIGCQWLKIVPDFYELFACKMTGHFCKMDGPVSTLYIYTSVNTVVEFHCKASEVF